MLLIAHGVTVFFMAGNQHTDVRKRKGVYQGGAFETEATVSII